MSSRDNLLPHGGEVYHYQSFFDPVISDDYFKNLLDQVSWRHEAIKIFGREVMQPRLTASFAEEGVEYGYSGIRLKSEKFNEPLLEIREAVQRVPGATFNTALLNLYRDGKDSMGWHRDNESDLGPKPIIASVSFGASREFQLREYANKKNKIKIVLSNGDLLIMSGESQHLWEHSLPKTAKAVGKRINVTFRNVQ